MKKKWWLLGAGAALIGGSCAGWMLWGGNEAETTAAAAVVTTQVRKGSLEVRISGTGSVEPAERETITVNKQGTVDEVFVTEGDLVKKGDVLFTFEQTDETDSIAAKELDLKKQQLDLESLQLQYREAAGAESDSVESLRISIQKQQLSIEELRGEIADLLAEEEETLAPVTAPIDGKLTAFTVAPGDTIGNNNSVVGEIADYAGMKMVVGVDELDIAKVQLDQTAEILVDALPDEAYAGRVIDIAEEGSANNGVASFDVTLLFDSVENLKAGMSAEASIVTAQKDDALYLPIDAVQSMRGRYFVLVPSAEGAEEGEADRGSEDAAEGALGASGEAAAGSEGASDGATGDFARPDGGTARSEDGAAGGFARPDGGAERPAMGGAAGGTTAMTGTGAAGQRRVPVEVGIHNEDSIEILSGLAEGDAVILPVAAASAAAAVQQAMPGGGFGIGVPGIGGAAQGGNFVRPATGGGGGGGGGGGRP
ncbi:efflux RND transporter periplasmic adaptor subunit [Paenibacillus sp. TRM 82003]|nr:efflux RND transporter periplasmic adaptor subunit [Paenibacillus sp. TRM 82003]